jgi:hypothetical protein
LTLTPGQTAPVWDGLVSGGSSWVNGVSEVLSANQPDPDSTPNNHVTTEDDYLTFTTS